MSSRPNISPPLASAISDALEKFAARGERRLIPRKDKNNTEIPYLYRNFLEGKHAPDGEPGLFLHKFVDSDKDKELHNHPWVWSVSFILVGQYRETKSRTVKNSEAKPDELFLAAPITRLFKEGDINYISQSDFHRVELITPHVWTLFLHGPRKHEWGFVEENYNSPVEVKIVKTRTFDARKKVTNA